MRQIFNAAILCGTALQNINGSVGYVNTKYNKLTLQGTVLDGNKLPFAPEWTAQVSADVRLFDTNEHKLTFSPSVNRNLLRKKTYLYGLDLRGSGFPYNYLVQDLPRTFGASIRYAF